MPKDVTLLGIVIFVRPVQLANAELSIFVTLLGIVIEDSLLQDRNAPALIEVKVFGNTIVVKLQLLNAALSIPVTDLPPISLGMLRMPTFSPML